MINCIAIDDEPLALDVIENHISKIPFLNLKARFQNPLEAIEYLYNNKVDLVFLDIQMPELTGFEVLKTLSNKPMVIFTTAYPNYALESYEMDAVDYLVKPIPFDRFLKSVMKVKQRLTPVTTTVTNQETSPKQIEQEFIFVKTEYKTVRINYKDIHFVESMKDYVIFHLENETISSLLSIKNVEETLPKETFLRIHRSFIISLNKIESIERNTVIILNNRLSVGTNYREKFKELVEKFRLS